MTNVKKENFWINKNKDYALVAFFRNGFILAILQKLFYFVPSLLFEKNLAFFYLNIFLLVGEKRV